MTPAKIHDRDLYLDERIAELESPIGRTGPEDGLAASLLLAVHHDVAVTGLLDEDVSNPPAVDIILNGKW